MKKHYLVVLTILLSSLAFADTTPVVVSSELSEYSNPRTVKYYNNPNINSRLYSGALFANQNNVTTGPSNYDKKVKNSSQKVAFEKNTSTNSNYSNSPNVNSRLYSGAQFPQQNNITGEKGADKVAVDNTKYKNIPTVNSRLYSGALFPEENNLNNI